MAVVGWRQVTVQARWHRSVVHRCVVRASGRVVCASFGAWCELWSSRRRVRQVLQRAAMGDSNQEIGRSLFLSPDTVKTHIARILRKLPARDRTHAALRGVRWGLIDWPDELEGG